MEPQYFQPGVTWSTVHHAPYDVNFTAVLPPFVGVSGHHYGFLSSHPIEKWEEHKQNESKY